MPTRRNRSLQGGQFSWQTLLLAVIIALYFSAISLHQTHASEFSDMPTVAISVHSLDPGNSERDMSPYSPQCADQVHCNSAAILPCEAAGRAGDVAGAISSTQAFVRQQFFPFSAPPPKFS